MNFKKHKKYIPLIMIVIALLMLKIFDDSRQSDDVNVLSVNTMEVMEVHYIDVEQGDSTLLRGPDFTILIDAGRHDRNDVLPYLRQAGVEQIDLFVLTHPHADHIGQADVVLDKYVVKEVWASGNEHTSRTFERVLDAIIDSEANYNEPQSGEKYTIGQANITILHPDELTGDLNDDSISFALEYGNIRFLFTGDVEQEGETNMIARGHHLKSDILKLGHHGSSTSSTEDFLNAVQPTIAIYSAGADNSYGHPHTEVVERIQAMNIELYGTDVHGTVIVTTDGQTFDVETERTGNITSIQ